MNKECECVKKWKEKVKQKLNAVHVASSIPYNSEHLSYRKMVIPKNVYNRDYGKPRLSKYWFCADSKDFKFCPHCGKRLKKEKKQWN